MSAASAQEGRRADVLVLGGGIVGASAALHLRRHGLSVILIERDIEEILASQRQMISRRGREVEQTPARLNRLRQEYLRLIVWAKGFLAGRPSTSLMCVNRGAILRDPQRAAEALNRFLGGNLHVERMAAEVKPELNRQRGVSSST